MNAFEKKIKSGARKSNIRKSDKQTKCALNLRKILFLILG